MKLRGIEFGNILGGSGVQGFKGDGSEYWLHRAPKWIRPSFTGMTFVAKTITLHARAGNMELDDELRPVEIFPKCIAFNPLTRAVINAVGLSNPGVEKILQMGFWQSRTKPFMISFMSTALTREERLEELEEFVRLLEKELPHFLAPIALQINFSCPNAGLNPTELLQEVEDALFVASVLGIPLIPKFSVNQVSVDSVLEIAENENCDAICISNTIPWSTLPWWLRLVSFGSLTSPMLRRGFVQEGGYSGPYLFNKVLRWVEEARGKGIKTPIIAGGGIFSKTDIWRLYSSGANAVSIATVAMMRPWRVQKLIKYANSLTWN